MTKTTYNKDSYQEKINHINHNTGEDPYMAIKLLGFAFALLMVAIMFR